MRPIVEYGGEPVKFHKLANEFLSTLVLSATNVILVYGGTLSEVDALKKRQTHIGIFY